jgi:lipoprotein-anchoring transpeptidase ErfK/SrfK
MRLPVAKISVFVALCLIYGRVFVFSAQAAEGVPTPPSTLAGEILDSDRDGLRDWKEIQIYHTDPYNKDTDGDGFDDAFEIRNGYSPLSKAATKLVNMDTDKDVMNDEWEMSYGTDFRNPDTDGDGLKDGAEIYNATDPLSVSTKKLTKVIKVDVAKHHLTYYLGDRPLESFAISAGKPKTPTPLGTFAVMQKLPVVRFKGKGYDYPNTKWNLLFTRANGHGYYVHGAYWHSKWGRAVSGGCVNVRYDQMERLYKFAEVGTKVITAKGSE